MTNYSVTDWVSVVGSLSTVADAVETKLETIDNSKTIRLLEIKSIANQTFQAIMVYDA